MTLKILSWNILQGGGSRIQSIVNFLLEQNAEIICLSEFHNNTNGYFLRSSLLKSGWIHQSTGANAEENNTVFIASKIPFESSYPAKNLDTYQDLMIKANFSAFSLYNNYFPHKKEHKLFDILFEELHSNSNAIIVGDLNTGKNYIDQVGDSFWYQKEFSTLEKNNFIDAFRFFHKEKKEYSWYSHQGNGYRYDHTFFYQTLSAIAKNCYYLHEVREQKISDHSPMILELGI
jgi:exonuclease III